MNLMTTEWRRPARRTLPDLLDWAERLPEALAWANLPMTRGVSGFRVEEFIEDDTYTVRAELPGVDPEQDIRVEVDNGLMTIRAERREERHERGTTEFNYGRFERRMVLPEGADESQINARYDAGVLEVSVPIRRPERPKPRAIPVQRAGEAATGKPRERLSQAEQPQAEQEELPGQQ
jgi:HSP20 family protein